MIKIICRSNKKQTKIPGYPLLVTLHATYSHVCALTKSARGIVLVNPRPQFIMKDLRLKYMYKLFKITHILYLP